MATRNSICKTHKSRDATRVFEILTLATFLMREMRRRGMRAHSAFFASLCITKRVANRAKKLSLFASSGLEIFEISRMECVLTCRPRLCRLRDFPHLQDIEISCLESRYERVASSCPPPGIAGPTPGAGRGGTSEFPFKSVEDVSSRQKLFSLQLYRRRVKTRIPRRQSPTRLDIVYIRGALRCSCVSRCLRECFLDISRFRVSMASWEITLCHRQVPTRNQGAFFLTLRGPSSVGEKTGGKPESYHRRSPAAKVGKSSRVSLSKVVCQTLGYKSV